MIIYLCCIYINNKCSVSSRSISGESDPSASIDRRPSTFNPEMNKKKQEERSKILTIALSSQMYDVDNSSDEEVDVDTSLRKTLNKLEQYEVMYIVYTSNPSN